LARGPPIESERVKNDTCGQGPGPETTAALRRDGAAPLRGLIGAAGPGDPGLFFEDFCNRREISVFNPFIEAGPLAAVAAALMGARQVRSHHDHVLVKEGGTVTPAPWRQAQPYYAGAPMDRRLFPVVWSG
jgi:hypothetical protein